MRYIHNIALTATRDTPTIIEIFWRITLLTNIDCQDHPESLFQNIPPSDGQTLEWSYEAHKENHKQTPPNRKFASYLRLVGFKCEIAPEAGSGHREFHLCAILNSYYNIQHATI